jgi:cystathionine beta-lyase
MSDPFAHLTLESLRRRQSEKWTTYPADVLPAFVAEMDCSLAEPIQQALLRAIVDGDTGYAHPVGLADAFAHFAQEWYGWSVDPHAVFTVPDVTVGVAEVLRLTTAPGDGVVINTPAYPPFFPTITESGRKVVDVPLVLGAQGWELDFAAMEQAFGAGARAYVLCNPHNPTGRVFRRAELDRIADLAGRYRVAVIADENHAPLTLPGATHTPYVALGEPAAALAVTVTSAAKAWNIAGLKCAVIVAGSPAMREHLVRLPGGTISGLGHFGVLAAIAAYREGGPWLRSVIARLAENRALLATLLAEHLPAIGYRPPEAGYLAWLDCRQLGLGDDPAAHFLARGRVALSRGRDFGPNGSGWARLNMGTSPELLAESVRRMAAALA